MGEMVWLPSLALNLALFQRQQGPVVKSIDLGVCLQGFGPGSAISCVILSKSSTSYASRSSSVKRG